MTDDYLIRHCAPTLAGIKTASLFTCPYETKQALLDSLRQLNRKLGSKGLRIIPLRFSDKKALIYAYRPGRLTADLSDSGAETLLQSCGYCPGSCAHCVGTLCRKLRQQEAFPHEIGLFLGYPVEDVRGFMEQGPDGCKLNGCWKVYGDKESAQKKFAQYKKCTRVYREKWAQGSSIDRLTVPTRTPPA